jgi:hypothetical protein
MLRPTRRLPRAAFIMFFPDGYFGAKLIPNPWSELASSAECFPEKWEQVRATARYFLR